MRQSVINTCLATIFHVPIRGKLWPDRYLNTTVYVSLILILSALVVPSRVGCLWITGVRLDVHV